MTSSIPACSRPGRAPRTLRAWLTTLGLTLGAIATLVAATPSNGTTTFGSGAGDAPLASGAGNAGVTASNVRGTGWDVRVVTTTSTSVSIVAGDLVYGTDDGIYYSDGAFDGEPLSSFRVSSNDGSIFDLQSFQFSATDGDDGTGTLYFTVTGYRGGAPVAGATANFTITGSGGNYSLTTVNVSADPDFVGIDAFVVTRASGEDVYFFAIDNLAVANVRAPNTAPVVSNLHGDSVGFIEGGAAATLDAGTAATVSDGDSGDFNGGSITATIVTNRVDAEDVLAPTSGGSFTISGANLQSGGLTFATVAGGTGANPLVISLTGSGTSATVALVQDVVRHLAYSNTNTATPSTATRTVRVLVNDGDGGTSANADVTVAVTGVNDAPTLSATGGTPTFTEDGSAVDLFGGVSISTVESGQTITALTMTVTNVADGSSEVLRADGTDIALTNGTSGTTAVNSMSYSVSVTGSTATATLTSVGGLSTAAAQTLVDGLSYRNSSNAPSTTTRAVTLTGIRDNGGTSNGGADTSPLSLAATVSVATTNDAPVLTTSGGTTAFTEAASGNSTPVIVDAGLTLSDVDNATLAAALVAITGNFQSGEDVLSYTNDGSTMGNVSASYNAATGVLTLTSAGATATIAQWQAALRAVQYTNGAETPATATRTASFTVNDGDDDSIGATKLISVAAVNDAPNVTAPATLAVSEDVGSAITGISFSDTDAGSASVTATLSVPSGTLAGTSGGGVTVGGSASALTLTGSIANLNTYIAGSNLTFTTAAHATSTVTLSVSIDDAGNSGSGGAKTGSASITLLVSDINDAPVITAVASIAVTEDVAAAVTGVSFADVDAGGAAVSVTFAVPSGTLTAASGGGVVVAGSGTGTLGLAGSLADVNAFIAASSLAFRTPDDATANVVLTVAIDDGGNSGTDPGLTGTATSEGASTTVTLNVDAVNDAPLNIVPTAQSTPRDVPIAFSSGAGTLVAVTDVDAAGSPVQVSLTAGNGTITLVGTTGLSFLTGDGTGDGTITFTGSLTDVNAAINGMWFTPTAGFTGAASLTVNSSDLGATGSGGAQVDADTVDISVTPVVPRVTQVISLSPNGTYKQGDTVILAVDFDEPVTVSTGGGVPTLLLAAGAVDRAAVYAAGSGTAQLSFVYIVQAGDQSANLEYVSTTALALNGATIRGATHLDASLTLASPATCTSLGAHAALVVDGIAPTVALGAPSEAATEHGPVSLVVTYAGADTITLTAGDVSLDSTGTATGTVAVTGTGPTSRTITISAIDGHGTLAVRIAADTARDAAGNAAAAAGPSSALAVNGIAITSVYPASGLADGGIAVTVSGVGFASMTPPQIDFGTSASARVEVVSDTTLRVITPALAAGTALDVVLRDAGGDVLGTLDAGFTPLARPDDPELDTDEDGLPDLWEMQFGLDARDATDAGNDADQDGATNAAEFGAGDHPRGGARLAFAEGIVNATFATRLVFFNPDLERASIVVWYLPEGGAPVRDLVEVSPGETVVREAAALPMLADGAFSVDSDANVRTVISSLTTWDATGYGSGAEVAVAPASTWYLAEGATHGPFDLFYFVANLEEAPVDVDVTFLRPAPEPPLVRRYTVAARSRLTLWVDTLDPALAATDVSAIVRAVDDKAIVVERAMYAQDGSGRFGAAGHRAAGVSAPAETWRLAEGYVGGPFDTYILVANPNPFEVSVSVEAVGETGILHTQSLDIAAGSRATLYAGDMPLPVGPVAFVVRAGSCSPIVVERAMWWRAEPGGAWVESHASAGATFSGTRWAFTDVTVGGARHEAQYLLVQNADSVPAAVEVALSLAGGSTLTRSFEVAAGARLTVDLASAFPEAQGQVSSAVINATAAVVAEVSRYWDAGGVHWAAGSNAPALRLDGGHGAGACSIAAGNQ